jgi:hypothetical protein
MLEINFPAKPLGDSFSTPKESIDDRGTGSRSCFAILFGADVIHASRAIEAKTGPKEQPVVSQNCVLLQELPWFSGFGEGKRLLWRG